VTAWTRLHHVVFATEPTNQEAAAALWRDLGLSFVDIDLSEIGLRVLLDWAGGVEIISPLGTGSEGRAVRSFLDSQGEGVVFGRRAHSRRRGSAWCRQPPRRYSRISLTKGVQSFILDEARLNPLHGMDATLLSTDLPD
jgi:hypothetical protein